ncbi:hypothetical protein BXZ70DRAFT_1009551 [Cristinia sonorae]|uniref:Uncharacterized protein n=1 Tax=Cristinia sonorae TaxID=1940300 RepID=A0A8K0UKR3_9AGAR|nr:hypothetical protein BXZ70DRAFT_1009551 [Cristinia sonorae]
MSFLARVFGGLLTTSSDVKNAKPPSVLAHHDRYTRFPRRMKKDRDEAKQRPVMNIGAPTNFQHLSGFEQIQLPEERRPGRVAILSPQRPGMGGPSNQTTRVTFAPERANLTTISEEQNAPESARSPRPQLCDPTPQPQIIAPPSKPATEPARSHHLRRSPTRIDPPQEVSAVRLRHPVDEVDRLKLEIRKLQTEVNERQRENLVYLSEKLKWQKKAKAYEQDLRVMGRAKNNLQDDKARSERTILILLRQLDSLQGGAAGTGSPEQPTSFLTVPEIPAGPNPVTPPYTPEDGHAHLEASSSVSCRATVNDAGWEKFEEYPPLIEVSHDPVCSQNAPGNPVRRLAQWCQDVDGRFFDAIERLE